jgi:hypothetical protein
MVQNQKEVALNQSSLKSYTVYDNTDGAYTIWYQYFDYSIKQYLKKSYYAYNKQKMLSFTKDLEKNGYIFVGKL